MYFLLREEGGEALTDAKQSCPLQEMNRTSLTYPPLSPRSSVSPPKEKEKEKKTSPKLTLSVEAQSQGSFACVPRYVKADSVGPPPPLFARRSSLLTPHQHHVVLFMCAPSYLLPGNNGHWSVWVVHTTD